MKRIIYTMVCFLFMITGYSCSKNPSEEKVDIPDEENSIPEEEVYSPLPPPNYVISSYFKDTYFRFIQRDDVYLVKGIALDVYEYGRKIEVIEDLKGNFDDKSSIFVWGDGFPSKESGFIGFETNRVAPLMTWYNDKDTLIIFMQKILKDYDDCIEKAGDYGTLIYANSILKYSDGLVTGNITANSFYEEISQWDELVDKWQAFLNKNERPHWWWSEKMIPPRPFESNLRINLNRNNSLIKGLVLGQHNGYGKKMQVLQVLCDLGGNLPKETSTIIAWGEDRPAGEPANNVTSRRIDDLRNYNNGDTLFMFFYQIIDEVNGRPVPPYDFEKKGDYYTFQDYAVLKLSNDSVSGCITSRYWEKETMPLKNFEQLINSIIQTKQ